MDKNNNEEILGMLKETKAITDLEELENAEEEHVMDPTENSDQGDVQQASTTLTDPTMEGMNSAQQVASAVYTGMTPVSLSGKAFKEFVENKGVDVELSSDNRTLRVKGLMSFTNSGKKTMEDYKPSQEDMDVINKDHSNMDLSRDAILTFTLRSADLAVDRSYEHFTEPALQKMAEMSVGKSFLMDHDWTTSSHIGKIYSASVENGSLLQKVYMLNDEFNKKTINNILAGIYNKVSVGFGVDLGAMMCDSCGTKSYYDEICPHTVGSMDERKGLTTITIKDVSDYFEVSLVPVPAQRDAGIRRSLTKTLRETEDSDTINNSKSVLGEMAVPENKQDKTPGEPNTKDLANIPPVDAKPQHVDDAGKAAPPDDKKDDEPDEDDKGCGAGMPPKKEDEKSLTVGMDDKLNKAIKKLNKLTKKHKKSLKKQLAAVEQLNAANGERVKQLESQVKEQGERLVALFGFVEEAAGKSYEGLLQDSNMIASNVEKSTKSSGQWFENLNNSFLSGGQ